MNLYIWKRLGKLTTNYHPEGGLAVFAETLERAREQAVASGEVVEGTDALTSDPDITVKVPDGQLPDVLVFPDAGCC